jgi:hypothetical protein
MEHTYMRLSLTYLALKSGVGCFNQAFQSTNVVGFEKGMTNFCHISIFAVKILINTWILTPLKNTRIPYVQTLA